MAKRDKRRERPEKPAHEYRDTDGNVLKLRETLSPKSAKKIAKVVADSGTSVDDAWRRRSEMLFEHLAVSWEVAGLPLDDQAMLIGRYRMASPDEQRWVRETINSHIQRFMPELAGE